MPVSANASREAFLVADGDGRKIDSFGNEITIKVSSRDTNGAFNVIEGQILPLQGPPLHLHRDQDECWRVLEGNFRFHVDGQEIHAGPGDTVFAPRGSRHTFQNIGSTPGRMVTTIVPGGLDLFFEEIESASRRDTAPDPVKLRPIFEKYHHELLGPPLGELNRGIQDPPTA